MSDLLELAIEAHGGWDRWQAVTRMDALAKIGGGLWPLKGKAGVLDKARIEVDPHWQHVEYHPFGTPDRYSVYEPHHTAIKSDNGDTLESRDDPRASFAGHAPQTPWDNQHLIYFSGYAIWTYLTTPFLFRLPGFKTEEIAPWMEDGEEWRRLMVNFPAKVHSHSPEQVFYFNQKGILQRHDYSVDVMGGTASANYASEPRTFGGIVIPTKRRVFTRDKENRALKDRVAVSIDILNVDLG